MFLEGNDLFFERGFISNNFSFDRMIFKRFFAFFVQKQTLKKSSSIIY